MLYCYCYWFVYVLVKVKFLVSGPVQDMKLAMSVYKYITASVKEPTSYLRLVGPTRRVTTGPTESNLQPQRRRWWEVGGSNPIPSECSMQGTDSNYSTWNDRNPLFLLQTDKLNQNGVFAFHSTHVRPQSAGDCYCLIYRMHPLLPGGTGLPFLY